MAGKNLDKIRYTGIQPQYFPRLHYFARVLNADLFMIRDDAQFVRKHKYPDGSTGKSYQAHSPIKQSYGVQLLSVPLKHNEERFLPIFETELPVGLPWIKDHLLTIKIAYGKSKNFKTMYGGVEALLAGSYKSLADLNNATIYWGILTLFGKEISPETLTLKYVNSVLSDQTVFRLKEIRKGSESITFKKSDSGLNANEKILALIKEVGAIEDYCGGTGVAAYVDHSLFEKAGITITVQDWKCKEYPQQFVKQQGFIPNLSILDLLLNVSSKEAISVLS